MPTNTAGLRIALRRLNGNPMTYHNNPYSQRLMGLNGDLTSYLVRGRSGEAIEVLTKFTKDYKLHGASGVRITIAIGYRVQDPSHLTDTQSFWVDEANLYQTRTFDKISRWSSEVSKAAATRFSIPKLDCELLVECNSCHFADLLQLSPTVPAEIPCGRNLALPTWDVSRFSSLAVT